MKFKVAHYQQAWMLDSVYCSW